jgi:hypothetical protein
MSSAVKREMLFWLTAATVMGGYLALGSWLAPEVPPEPESRTGRVLTMDEAIKLFAKSRERRDAQIRRNEFLRDWYRWGAGVAIGLVLVYTWLRPPWRAPAAEEPQPRDRPGNPAPRLLPVSRRALFQMAAALLLIVVVLVLLATLIT